MTRPSLLWVTAEPPNEQLGGGSVRQSQLLRRLGRLADVDLLVLGTETDDHVRAAVGSLTEVPDPGLPPRLVGVTGALQRARVLAVDRSTASISAEGERARQLVEKARDLASGHDAVVVVHEALATAAPEPRAQRWFLHLHHVAARRSAQRARVEPSLRRRLVHRLEAENAARWIRRTAGRWDGVITVSEADAEALGLDPGATTIVPNGVDVDVFDPSPRPAQGPVVMTGSLDYLPNVDGARWFVQEAWPTVVAHRPGTRLQLVGRSPVPEVLALQQHAGVSVHADVPDIRPWLAGAAAVVVPLRIGTGTRIKALEAMAARRPLVGTTIGLEGLDVVDGRHALVADTADAFAHAVVRVLTDEALASELTATARAHVEAHFDWGTIAAGLAEAITRAP